MEKKYKTEEEYRRGGWRCFHCDETFTTPGAAEDHFGNYLNSTPGCIIKVQVGDERGWLMELRRVQEENAHLRQQMNEEYWNMTAYGAHLKTNIQSYRPFGKCETLQDVFNVYDSMEGRALAGEECIARLMMLHTYVIDIEYIDDPVMKPIAVTLTRGKESKENYGKSLNALLNEVKDWIIKEENK